jgi:hypothetical protein
MRRPILYYLLAGAAVVAAWLLFFAWQRRQIDAVTGVLTGMLGG